MAKTKARKATVKKARDPQVEAWVAREIAEQEKRYRGIVREMDALEQRRRRWILEFYERIQTRGYSIHAGLRRKVAREEIPPLPKGKIRVVW
jgi:hypothetical protein